MGPGAFSALMENLQRLSWGEEKLHIAQDAARSGNYFSCQQIVEMMDATSGGEDKTKIAAALYERAVDPQNFALLTAALPSESERQQLRRSLGK
jgi:hypothetical protein